MKKTIPPNELELIRRETGYPIRPFLVEIGSNATRIHLLERKDRLIDRAYLDNARQLRDDYREWKQQLLQHVDVLAPMTVPQFSKLLGYDLPTTYALVSRGMLEPKGEGGKNDQYLITRAELEQFFHTSESCLDPAWPHARRTRGPLHRAFVQWRRAQRYKNSANKRIHTVDKERIAV